MIERKLKEEASNSTYYRSDGHGFTISENYYPITSTISIEDLERKMIVSTDRA